MKYKSPITGKLAGPAPVPKIASKRGRRIIRRHHTLLKQKTQLEQRLQSHPDDLDARERLAAVQTELGDAKGLDKYQKASIAGQDPRRGGDSSRVLVDWVCGNDSTVSLGSVLEVGCLQVDNAVAKRCTSIERIDLNSQHPDIRSQDFMTLDTGPRYNVVSLSLVVNFVPDVKTRGEMLRRTTKFLNKNGLLFLVLPAPCVANSRYFTEERLGEIMTSLGFALKQRKMTDRIAYWLYEYSGKPTRRKFGKDILNDGKIRNNFCIVLD